MPSSFAALACRLAAIRIDMRTLQRVQVAQVARDYDYTVEEANGTQVIHHVVQGAGGKWVANEVVGTIGGTGKSAWEGVTHVGAHAGKSGGGGTKVSTKPDIAASERVRINAAIAQAKKERLAATKARDNAENDIKLLQEHFGEELPAHAQAVITNLQALFDAHQARIDALTERISDLRSQLPRGKRLTDEMKAFRTEQRARITADIRATQKAIRTLEREGAKRGSIDKERLRDLQRQLIAHMDRRDALKGVSYRQWQRWMDEGVDPTRGGTKAAASAKDMSVPTKAPAAPTVENRPPLERIAASMQRLPDLNPDGATHEFYQSTVDGMTYFLKPSGPVGTQSAEMAYHVAQQLGLAEFVSPSWSVEHDGRMYQVMPMIPGTQMRYAEPAEWKAALAKIDPVTQAKLGLYSVMMGMDDVAGNNVMLTPEGHLVMIDTDQILGGVGTTPVMLNAYFGNSLGLMKGEAVSEKARTAMENRIRRMAIPPEAIAWLKNEVLAHQSALLDQIDHIAQLHHSDYHEQAKWSGYTDMMASAMVRFAALRQIANMEHPTWGDLESIVWWKNGKYTENAMFQMVGYIGERYSWDHPAHNQDEVKALLASFGITLTNKGITYKPKYPEGEEE